MLGLFAFALACLEGWKNLNLKDEEAKLFHCTIDVAGALWKRQVLMCERFPWKLIAILDPGISEDEIRQLLSEFKSLDECDMDEGVTKIWHQLYGTSSDEDLLRTGSDFRCAVLLLALNKVTNIEIENNFARASSSRAYCRGKPHGVATMCSKHTLAELRHSHDLTETRMSQIAKKCGLNRQQLS